MKPMAPGDSAPLVSLADISEIELVILRRMKDVTIGEHRSRSHGAGFDFLGLRDWQAGDRFSSIEARSKPCFRRIRKKCPRA